MKREMRSRVVIGGAAEGTALVSQVPLSFWGGVDPATGRIIDVHHDLTGETITGKVLCIPYDRGSCSGSGVMLEMLRASTAPAAIVCLQAEPVLALGSVMGEQLYRRNVVIHTVAERDYQTLCTGDGILLLKSGGLVITPKREGRMG